MIHRGQGRGHSYQPQQQERYGTVMTEHRLGFKHGDNPLFNRLDPAHQSARIFADPFVTTIWADKYRWGDEASPWDSFCRVAHAIYDGDDPVHEQEALNAMSAGLFMPG